MLVRAFMTRIGETIHQRPALLEYKAAVRRHDLMAEELGEYLNAVEAGDLTGIGDALADLAYTVLGTASAHGIELEPLFDEVHASNMTKTPVGDGKIGFKLCVKGPDFKKPRIAELLLLQTVPGMEAAGYDRVLRFKDRLARAQETADNGMDTLEEAKGLK